MGVVIGKVIQATPITPCKITAVETTAESFVCCGGMGLVNDVPNPKNRKGFSRRSGHLQSLCCLTSMEKGKVVLTVWEDS